MQERSAKVREVYGVPTIQLTEGMLTMFIRSDASKQVIQFKHRESVASRVTGCESLVRNNGIVMDLGSLKETIMILPEESKSPERFHSPVSRAITPELRAQSLAENQPPKIKSED